MNGLKSINSRDYSIEELNKDTLKLVNRELIHKGGIINYYQDTVEFPNGNHEKWDIIEHKGAAGVLPVTREGKIVCVHQYRHAVKKNTIEIPAGGIDPKEDFIDCAQREMEEETGYTCISIEPFIDLISTIGFCNERIYLFKAVVEKNSVQKLDTNEYVRVKEYDISELVDMVLSRQIEDGKTISAIMTYAYQLERVKNESNMKSN